MPPSSASPRPPSGRRPRGTSSAGARKCCYYDLRYDAARSPGSAGAAREYPPKSAALGARTPAREAQHHRLKVVSVASHYRAEKREILQDSAVYGPVYFALPGFPAPMEKSFDGGMDKWDSARVLHKSRPVAAVLRHIEEQRYPLSPGGRKVRIAPLFDQQGHPVAAASPPQFHGRGTSSLDMGGTTPLASNAAKSSYMHCISSSVRIGGNTRPKTCASDGSYSISRSVGGYRAPRSAPALIGYKPVYISDSTMSSRKIAVSSLDRSLASSTNGYGSRSTQEHEQPTSLYDCGGYYRPNNVEPNQSAFMVSCTGREGRSHRTVASSRSCGYGGASGRAHCRALYSSQAGYTLGYVRRRNADEHAAAAKIQALFRGRYDFELFLVLACFECVRRLKF
eukprot:COSAG02_NODE_4863_length_4889_cov_1.815240_1_plen_396_part_00